MNLITENTQTRMAVLSVLFVLIAVAVSPATVKSIGDINVEAGPYQVQIRDCDEIWMVSTRELCPTAFSPEDFQVMQLMTGVWHQTEVQSLLSAHQTGTDRSTIVYVHGYRQNFYWARRRGLEVYEDLVTKSSDCPPIRYIIWVWPSEDNNRPVENYKRSLQRSLDEGNVFAWFLARAGDPDRIGVLAYSLGVQVSLRAFEHCHVSYQSEPGIRLATVASVTSCKWPFCSQQVSNSYAMIGKAIVVRNQLDYAVKFYRTGCGVVSHSKTLGIEHLQKHDYENKFRCIDAAPLVDREHQIHDYVRHQSITDAILDTLIR